jgi:hypothetical protein
LTQQDLDEGAHFYFVDSITTLVSSSDGFRIHNHWQWDNSGAVQRELIEVGLSRQTYQVRDDDLNWVSYDTWDIVVRERREGRFVIDGDRMEILWECEWGHWSGDVSITRNALAPDEIRLPHSYAGQFSRVEN